MGLLRSWRKFLLAPPLLLAVLLLFVVSASQIEQRVFRRRAELLLSQVQSFELRRTVRQDVQVRLARWNVNRSFSKSCDADRCSFEITLDEPVFAFVSKENLFVKLDDYLRWKLNLSYSTGPFVRAEFALLDGYLRLGGHPSQVIASFGMRDGVLWEKSFRVRIETYGHPAYWSPDDFRLEFPLLVSVYSVPRFQYHDSQEINSQLYLHPNYEIGRPGGCTICVHGWVHFTPYADPADVRRLTQLDLSCLTRWRPCTSQAEVMPAAWGQYQSELSRLAVHYHSVYSAPAAISKQPVELRPAVLSRH